MLECYKERYYLYFFCDPFKPFEGTGDYILSFAPYYCGKGTSTRIKSLKRSKRINDKTDSIRKKGVQQPWNKNLSAESDPRVSKNVQKMIESKKGIRWFTNGIRDVCKQECPEGFFPGRTNIGKKSKNNCSQKITIDGIEFSSISQAAKFFNITTYKLKKRVNKCY